MNNCKNQEKLTGDNMNRKKLILLIIFGFIVLIIIPIILYYLYVTPSKFGFIKPEDTGAWIGYYGSVLGGIITLSGVWITIRYYEKENKINKSIEYKPILVLTGLSVPEKILKSCKVSLGIQTLSSSDRTPGYIHKNVNKEVLNLCITNNGRGETSNAYLDFTVDTENLDWTEKHILYSSTSRQHIGEILSNENIGVKIELPSYLLVKEDIFFNKKYVEINTLLTLEYMDMFDRAKYKYILHLRFYADLIKGDRERTVSPSLIAVRVEYRLDQIMPIRNTLHEINKIKIEQN